MRGNSPCPNEARIADRPGSCSLEPCCRTLSLRNDGDDRRLAYSRKTECFLHESEASRGGADSGLFPGVGNADAHIYG